MRTIFTLAVLALSLAVGNAANFPYIRLNGKTNQISDNGTALTRDGVAIGSGGSSLWTTNGSTGVTLASPYTNVFIAGNEAQFTVGTAETNMPSAPFGDNLPAIGDNHHFFSTTDLLDDASSAAISAYGAASNPSSGIEGLDAVSYATGHDASVVGMTGGSYFDGGTNNRATMIGVQGIATFLSGGTPRYVAGGDFHWLTVATNDIAWGAGLVIEGIINAQGANVGTNYGIFVNDSAQFDIVVGLKDSYGIYVENQTGGTNNWAIKTGLGKVEFGDAVSTSSTISAGSTNAWKLGGVTNGAPNVEVNGTNYALATTNNFVAKTGDTMTGSLSVGGTNQSYFTNGLISGPITITNAATATTPFVINGASGETVDQMQIRVGGGAPIFTVNRYGGVASADDLVSGNNIVASQNGLIYWQSAAIMRAPSNGVFRFTDYSSVISNSVIQAGAITLYKQTNQVSFAGTNTPPGDISTIATWISVQVAGDTNVWRLPLYK